jgi:hypothetical protein
MPDPETLKEERRLFIPAGLFLCSLLMLRPLAAQNAGPVAQAPYKISVFATATSAYSQPDSMTHWGRSVLIGFQNHVAKDGSDGKSSTIVQYAPDGTVQRTFSVKGHNDGLRVVDGHNLWALQN